MDADTHPERVTRAWTTTLSGFPTASFVPSGVSQGNGVFGQNVGQAGEHAGELVLGVDAQAAVFYEGVKDAHF